MKTSELRTKSKEELKGLVLDLKKEQFNLRMQASTGELENKSRFKEVRRTIARAHTLIKELALMNEEPRTVKAKAPKAPKAKVEKEAAPKKAAAKKKTKE